MVEPDRNNHPNLLQEVKKYLKQTTNEKLPYAQHLHRLDRVTSGIVLFTKDKNYLRNLSEQFAQRQVKKEYVALTSSRLMAEALEATGQEKRNEFETSRAHSIGSATTSISVLKHWHRKEKKKAVISDIEMPYSEKALLDYVIEPQGNFFKWKIHLHTGKYHQIRAQLAHIGYPIVGDIIYGSEIKYKENAITLCATKLTIKHPTTKNEMVFEVIPSFSEISS